MKLTSPLLEDLQRDHLNLVELIEVARRELHEIETAQVPDFELLVDALRYITSYCDTQHHPNEDVVFEVLKRLAPHTSAQIARIADEHVQLGEAGRNLLEKLDSIVEDAIVPRRELVAEGVAYFDALHAHMGTEEAHLFPLADRMLSEADWHAVRARLLDASDPLFGHTKSDDFRRLWERIEAHRETQNL